MSQKELIKHWREGAKDALETAGYLMKTKRFDHALFFGHLALEKLLKSLVIEYGEANAPYTHDLAQLAHKAHIELRKEQEEGLLQINLFNIEGRYPEEKALLRKTTTPEIAEYWWKRINEYFVWLQKGSK
ncbi:MAG: HEPN domain-containing protein [bacterium]|nr:HEPN domain-containing protein [bacterium]